MGPPVRGLAGVRLKYASAWRQACGFNSVSVHATGVNADNVFCSDWREGENILMLGQQVTLKFELRQLGLGT